MTLPAPFRRPIDRPARALFLSAVLTLICASASDLRADPLFAAPHLFFDTGGTNNSLAMADFDLDGKLDVVVANGPVSFLRGLGDGTFAPYVNVTSGDARVLVVQDMNGDTWPDIVCGDGAAIEVVLGNGDGTFDPPLVTTLTSVPRWIETGDLDSDGDFDVVTNLENSNSYSLLGSGNGSLQPPVNWFSSNARSLALGHFDADTWLDIAYCDYFNFNLNVLPGLGNGSFGGGVGYTTAPYPYGIETADFDGDGRMDLAHTNVGSQTLNVSVRLGLGNGSFAPQTDYPTGLTTQFIGAGDLDGDGDQDIVTSSTGFAVLVGDGSGAFAAAVPHPIGAFSYCVAIGDLNGDDLPDVVAAVAFPGVVVVSLGNGDGTFGLDRTFQTDSKPRGLAVGDINGDGWPDAAVSNPVLHTVQVMLGDGSGRLPVSTSYACASMPFAVAFHDLDGDGLQDLVSTDSLANHVRVRLGTGGGAFGATADYATGNGPNSVTAADLDGDGPVDLLVTCGGSAVVSVLPGVGGGAFGAKVDYPVGLLPQALVVGRFDANVTLDIAVACAGSDRVDILRGNGDLTFTSHAAVATGTFPRDLAIADFNSDTRPDLITADRGGPCTLALGNGDGTFTPVALGLDGNLAVTVADFDQDGFADAAFSRQYPQTTVLLRGHGNGTFDADAKHATNGSMRAVRASDFNGDGRPDLAFLSEFSGGRVLLNTGGQPWNAVLPRIPSPAPLDLGVHPVPASGSLTIAFAMPSAADASVQIFDTSGRLLRTLARGAFSVGRHSLFWDRRTSHGTTAPPGVYFVAVRGPAGNAMRRIVLTH